jgi:hypothetical protein
MLGLSFSCKAQVNLTVVLNTVLAEAMIGAGSCFTRAFRIALHRFGDNGVTFLQARLAWNHSIFYKHCFS